METDTVGAPIFNISSVVGGVSDNELPIEELIISRIMMLTARSMAEMRPSVVARVDNSIFEVICLPVDGDPRVFRFGVGDGDSDEVQSEMIAVIADVVGHFGAVTDMALNQFLCGFGSGEVLLE